MQAAYYLLPKSETSYLLKNYTLRQSIEIMQNNSLMSLPILDLDGCYIGSITAADILWFFKAHYDLNIKAAENVSLMTVPRRYDNQPVSIHAESKELIEAAIDQNFTPVIDDLGVFIGIVRRREILLDIQKSSQNWE